MFCARCLLPRAKYHPFAEGVDDMETHENTAIWTSVMDDPDARPATGYAGACARFAFVVPFLHYIAMELDLVQPGTSMADRFFTEVIEVQESKRRLPEMRSRRWTSGSDFLGWALSLNTIDRTILNAYVAIAWFMS